MNATSESVNRWLRPATVLQPASDRMSFVIRVFSLLLAGSSIWPDFAAAGDRISYQMRLVSGPAIEVTVQFRGSASGETVLSLVKEWGGIINDDRHVTQVTAMDAQGEQIRIEHPSVTEWKLTHRPNAQIQFQYVIPKTGDRPAVSGNDYRTLVDDDLFQCIGYLSLMIPRQMDQPSDGQPVDRRPSDRQSAEIEFSVQFLGFDTVSWQVVSSFGKGAGPFTVVCRPEKFLQTVILAGDLQIVERTIRNQQVAVAVFGRNWSFGPDELADAVEKIVMTERDFFVDHSDPWFLVTLTPVRIDSPNSISLGGTALHGAFALFCTENLTLSNADPMSFNAYSLLAHEYFHNWNGTKIPTAGDDPSTYWFSEGFTNYYARRMLLAAGLINEEQYGQMLSEAVARHDDNPFRTEKNDRIRSEFWTNRQIQDLPYSRGELIAVVLDQHIRERSRGDKSLDDFMRDLFRNPLQESPVTTEVLLDRLSSWVEPEILQAVAGWVTDGVAVDLPARLTSPDLQLSSGKLRQFDANFDVEKSRTDGQIAGVADDSEAFKAGLRNGQSLRRYSVLSGDGKSPPTAEVEVLSDGEVRTIRYTAIGPPKTVRQYVLRKD